MLGRKIEENSESNQKKRKNANIVAFHRNNERRFLQLKSSLKHISICVKWYKWIENQQCSVLSAYFYVHF